MAVGTWAVSPDRAGTVSRTMAGRGIASLRAGAVGDVVGAEVATVR